MLGTLTKGDAVKEATERRKEQARELRDQVAALEGQRKEIEKAQREHEKEVERIREEVRAKGHHVQFATFPSLAKAKARAAKGVQLQSDLKAVEQRLKVARRRAREAEARAKPLSPLAARRLQDLADAAAADEELVEFGINVDRLDRDTLLDAAQRFGITPTED